MGKRTLTIAAAVAGSVALLSGVASGCGDKFVLVGGGARVMRSKYPSRVLVFMNPASRVPGAEKELPVEATLTAAGHKTKVVESEGELQKTLDSGKYDLVLADPADVPQLRQRCGMVASKPAVLPLLYKPTAA